VREGEKREVNAGGKAVLFPGRQKEVAPGEEEELRDSDLARARGERAAGDGADLRDGQDEAVRA